MFEVIKNVKKDKRKGCVKKDVIIECLLNNEQDVSVNKCWFNYILAGSFLFEVNNGKTRTMCKICWKLTVKMLIVDFEQICTLFWCFHCWLEK